jgi:AraC family transcriptional regulator
MNITALAPRPARTDLQEVLNGSRRINLKWHELEVDYAWLPPFEGVAATRPNRIEVVFSAHKGVAIEHGGKVYDIDVQPGGTYAVGAEGTRLLQVREYSDTLEMYPSSDLLKTVATERGLSDLAIEPTLQGTEQKLFARNGLFLAQAHLLRSACMGQIALTDIEASTLTHQLVWHVVDTQHGIQKSNTSKTMSLSRANLARVCEFVETKLTDHISLSEMAACADVSAWHFARQFKAAIGVAPYQYALYRRMELAKRLLLTTSLSVQQIAWEIGFENQNHFRRQFRKHVGVMPGQIRAAIRH